MGVTLSSKRIGYLLDELCVELGFCLPPPEYVSLQNKPPTSVDAFTEAVFTAEGLDPKVNRQLRDQVQKRVASYFQQTDEEAA